MKQKTNYWGFILLPISIILLISTGWMGLLYTLLVSILKPLAFFKRMASFSMIIAISIDQLGNVILQDLLNKLFITKKSEHLFGNEDHTISSVLGENKKAQTLSLVGNRVAEILDFIDKNHVLNSIEH